MTDVAIILCLSFFFVMSIGLSYRAGFNANEKYHQQIRIAERNAVNDYKSKEYALFSLSQQEMDFYKRTIIKPVNNEIPLNSHHTRRFQDEKCSVFAGKKSEF